MMKFLSVRDLKTKSSQIWKDLPEEKEMVITNNGRPIALMVPVTESNLEKSISSFRQVQATKAVNSLQQKSVENSLNTMTMDEIEAEIATVRKNRKK